MPGTALSSSVGFPTQPLQAGPISPLSTSESHSVKRANKLLPHPALFVPSNGAPLQPREVNVTLLLVQGRKQTEEEIC